MVIRVIRSEIMGGGVNFPISRGGQRVGALLNPEGGMGRGRIKLPGGGGGGGGADPGQFLKTLSLSNPFII